MKQISIIGSTGSIGTQSLDIVRANDDSKVVALAAGSNVELLLKQAQEFKPDIIGIWDEDKAKELRTALSEFDIRIVSGMDGLIEVASYVKADIVITAIVGMIGIRPTVEAIKAGKDIALANKETLVAGGKLVINSAKEKGVNIYPVDSEHSAIFQCLQGNKKQQLKGIILTASGGPFYKMTKKELEDVGVEQALAHPNWSMGRKITIDSATLMNKGLEFIEAIWLFDLKPEQIEIVVQRQSVVHSAVEFMDNSVIAQMGVPDMKIPIQYALLYPDRLDCPTKHLSLTDYGTLSFDKPDYDTFDCLTACIKAITIGGTKPAIVNGANEAAVAAFLDGKIKFLKIGELVTKALENIKETDITCVQDVLDADKAAREYVREQIEKGVN